MASPTYFITFSLAERRLALNLDAVDRVVPAVHIDLLPQAPAAVPGVVNVRGRIMPVVDLRSSLGQPLHAMALTDRFLIARTSRRAVALWVDAVAGVIQPLPEDVIRADDIIPGMGSVEGAVRLPDGMILIYNLDRFLSVEEEDLLERAMERDQP